MKSGKQMAALLVGAKGDGEGDDEGDGLDLETLDSLSRKIILAVQKSDEKSLTDALRTFAAECRKEPDGDEDDAEED